MSLKRSVTYVIVIILSIGVYGLSQNTNMVPNKESLRAAFEKYTEAELARNWKECYRQLLHEIQNSMTESKYIKNQESEKHYRLKRFKIIEYKELDPNKLPGKWWIIVMCGHFRKGKTVNCYIAQAEAAWENGEWRFSDIGIATEALGAGPQLCNCSQ